MAKQNYERFFDMRPGTSTQQQIDRSSLTVDGWVATDVRENQGVSLNIVLIVRRRKSQLEQDAGHSDPRMLTVQLGRMRRSPR